MKFNQGERILVYMGKDSKYDEELWMTATYVRYRGHGHYVRIMKYDNGKGTMFKTDGDKIRRFV